MSDETKTNEDFLGDLRDNAEGDPFTPNNDDPFASVEETKEEVKAEEPVVEKEEKVPFHKDPKVQRYIEREVEKALSNKPEPESREVIDNPFDGVIKSFEAIIGNDTPEKVNALNGLKESLSILDERAAEKAISRLESIRQQELEQELEYENKIKDGFETIEGETGIDLYAPQNKKLRVKFLEFVEQVAPKEDGEISELPDMGATFKAFQAMYKPQSQAPKAKELASKSIGRANSEVNQIPDRGRITWDNVMEKIGL